MLEYDITDIAEGTDINKTNASKECKICNYLYFKDIGYKYEPYLYNGYHRLIQEAISFNLLLFILKEVLTEFTFGVWAKMMQ